MYAYLSSRHNTGRGEVRDAVIGVGRRVVSGRNKEMLGVRGARPVSVEKTGE